MSCKRTDIASLRHLSKLFFAARNKFPSEQARLSYYLCDHRNYDLITNHDVLQPFLFDNGDVPQWSRRELKRFYNALQAHDKKMAKELYGTADKASDFSKKRGNPTGSAVSHSGDCWLSNMLDTSLDNFANFTLNVWNAYNAHELRVTRQPGQGQVAWLPGRLSARGPFDRRPGLGS